MQGAGPGLRAEFGPFPDFILDGFRVPSVLKVEPNGSEPRGPVNWWPRMKPADEALLIRESLRGDLVAFEEIVRRKRERVFWTAYRIVGDEEAAKDVAQTVFVRTWRNLHKIDPDRPLDAWLHRTTVNLAIDSYRKTRREVRMFEPIESGTRPRRADRSPSGESPDAALGHAEVQDIFNRLAGRLSPMQRAAFVLVEMEGYSAAEAGHMLGVRPSTIRNHLLNARRQLRRHLCSLYPEYAAGNRRARTDPEGGSGEDR